MTANAIRGIKVDIVTLCETKLVVPPVRLTNALGAQRIDQLVTKDSIGASASIMIRFDSSSYIWRDEWIR